MPGRPTHPLVCIAVLFLLFFQAACSRSPSYSLEDSLKPFTGNWKVISLDRSGKTSNANALKNMFVTVEGDIFKFTDKSGPAQTKGRVTVRPIHREEYVLQVNPAKSGDVDFIWVQPVWLKGGYCCNFN